MQIHFDVYRYVYTMPDNSTSFIKKYIHRWRGYIKMCNVTRWRRNSWAKAREKEAKLKGVLLSLPFFFSSTLVDGRGGNEIVWAREEKRQNQKMLLEASSFFFTHLTALKRLHRCHVLISAPWWRWFDFYRAALFRMLSLGLEIKGLRQHEKVRLQF